MHDDNNKTLGLPFHGRHAPCNEVDTFLKEKKKMRLGQNLSHEQVRAQTPKPLTRRELLSQVSGVYDPVVLVTAAKQKGAILVHVAFQKANNRRVPVNATWDAALSDEFREDAIRLFEEYVQLVQIRFTRAITPPNSNFEPVAITFSDGSENAYGAVLYLRLN